MRVIDRGYQVFLRFPNARYSGVCEVRLSGGSMTRETLDILIETLILCRSWLPPSPEIAARSEPPMPLTETLVPSPLDRLLPAPEDV